MEFLLATIGLSVPQGIVLFGLLAGLSCLSCTLNYPIKNFEKRDFMNSVSKSLEKISEKSSKED